MSIELGQWLFTEHGEAEEVAVIIESTEETKSTQVKNKPKTAREAREAAGLTLAQAARKLGRKSARLLRHYELHGCPYLYIAEKIAIFYKCDPHVFQFGELREFGEAAKTPKSPQTSTVIVPYKFNCIQYERNLVNSQRRALARRWKKQVSRGHEFMSESTFVLCSEEL